MQTKKLIPSILVILFAFNSCNNVEKKAESVLRKIDPPLNELNVQMQTFSINTENEEIIYLESGTKITIPANALVDVNGNPVKGEADIAYREMHTALDVMLSGIPMEYDSAGTTYDFETAGMFEIRGFQNGNPVFIADGKEIQIDLASYNVGDDFGFYSLNEENGQWNFEGYSPSEPNQSREEMLNESLEKLDEIINNKEELKKSVAKINTQGTFSINVNYDRFPELQSFQTVLWRFAGKDRHLNVNEVQEMFNDPGKSMILSNHPTQPNLFLLSHRGNESINDAYTVEPFIPGISEEKQKAFLEERIANFNEVQRQAELRAEAARNQAETMRAFRVSNFGIFNCDKPIANNVIIAVNFEYDSENKPEKIYLISRNNRMLITYYPNLSDQIRVPKDDKFTFITVESDKSITIANREVMNRVETEINRTDNRNFTIQLTKSSRNFEDQTELVSYVEERL